MVRTLSNVGSPISEGLFTTFRRMLLISLALLTKNNPIHRARSITITAEVAGVDKPRKFVFQFQEKLGKALWLVVWDIQRFVREQSMLRLQAILNTIFIRDDQEVSENAMYQVLDSRTLSSTSVERPNTDTPKRDEGYKLNVGAVHGTLPFSHLC